MWIKVIKFKSVLVNSEHWNTALNKWEIWKAKEWTSSCQVEIIILEICDLNWICPTLYFAPFRLYECGSAGWLVACNLILSLLHFVSKKEKKTFEKKRHFAVAAKSLVAEKAFKDLEMKYNKSKWKKNHVVVEKN